MVRDTLETVGAPLWAFNVGTLTQPVQRLPPNDPLREKSRLRSTPGFRGIASESTADAVACF